ncbi:MAG: AMIN domain-containing protein [Azospirillum sp.]|nr:AMIN domain-containing protein [Azospirillum sp.]
MPALPRVIAARIGLHPDKTRFVLEVTDPIDYRVTTQADPFQVVIDFPRLQWPGDGHRTKGRGAILAFAQQRTDTGATRAVLDVVGPVAVRSAYIIPPSEGYRSRFVLDLAPVSLGEFMRDKGVVRDSRGGTAPPEEPIAVRPPAAAIAPVPAVFTPTPEVEPPGHPVPLPPPTPAITQVAAALPPPIPPDLPLPRRRPPVAGEKRVIVIDPGHGGQDPGAIGVGGIHEKDITLAAAREARRQLEATGRYRVVLTRDSDTFIRLRDRTAKAREAGADLFVSLHADSIGREQVRGLSIYTLSDKASDREAEMLAASENRADALGGIDLSAENDQIATILIDLAQRDTMNHSRRFATIATSELGHDVKLLPKPHRSAGFAVLTAPDVPSVLVEMGYLSSPQDSNLLTQPQYRERLAKALTRAINGYFAWLGGMRKS